MVSISFLHKMAMLIQSFMPDKFQSQNFFLIFLMERPYYTLKIILPLQYFADTLTKYRFPLAKALATVECGGGIPRLLCGLLQ